MPKTKPGKVEALHGLLAEERRKVVAIAAESGMLPPSGLLAYLADLDGAAQAVEAVLEEYGMLEARPAASASVN